MSNSQKDREEDGIKWWLRYVIVPLFGGGGVVAIIIALMSRPIPSTPIEKPPPVPVVASPSIADKIPSSHPVLKTPEEKLQQMAKEYGFRCYILTNDESFNTTSELGSINRRPLYVLDTNKMDGIPANKIDAQRLFTEYFALQNGDQRTVVNKKLSLLQAANEVKRLSIWVKTDLRGASAVKIYAARPQVKIQVNGVTSEFQKEVQMFFFSKDNDNTFVMQSIMAELEKTANGILMSNIPINDIRVREVLSF